MSDDRQREEIERFGELSALVYDGYAPRAGILASAGMDLLGWLDLEQRLLPRLAAGDPDVAVRFAIAYARARRLQAATTIVEVEAPHHDASDALADATAITATPCVASTPSEAADLTMECAPDAAGRSVMPFGKPPPGKRWAYFDTRTGALLASPTLIDDPDHA